MSVYDRIEERSNREGDTFRWVLTERGTRYTNLDCIGKVKAAEAAFARWFSRAVKTRTTWGPELAECNASDIEELRWRLREMQTYVEAASRHLDDLEGTDRRAERVKALREVAGRTPAEAALYLAKADQIEAFDAG